MDEQKKKTGAAALRKGLRDERRSRSSGEASNTANGTGETAISINGVDAEQERATFQAPRRKASRITPTGGTPDASTGRTGNDKRSIAREPERVGRGSRRAEESNGGAPANPATTERSQEPAASQYPTVGRLEATETILEPSVPKFDLRPDAILPGVGVRFKDDYKRTKRNGENVYALISNSDEIITPDEYNSLTSRKESDLPVTHDSPEPKPGFFKSKVLSKQEAEDLYEPLVAAISDGFGYADKGLWQLCPQLDERPVWSNTTPREDQALARVLLKRGQVSPAAALIVREAVNSGDYVVVGLAFGPRIIETLQAVRERPAPEPKKKLTLFRKAQSAE